MPLIARSAGVAIGFGGDALVTVVSSDDQFGVIDGGDALGGDDLTLFGGVADQAFLSYLDAGGA